LLFYIDVKIQLVLFCQRIHRKGTTTIREFANISPQFWINERGRTIKKLGLKAQLIAIYLLTNPHANMIGIYYLPSALIAHETGIELNATVKGLQNLSAANFCSYDPTSEYVWVHDMAFEQIGTDLKEQDNRVKGVKYEYASLPKLPFLKSFFDKYAETFYLNSLEEPSKPLTSKENNKDKDKDNHNEKKKDTSGKPDTSSRNKDFFNPEVKAQAIEILEFLNEKTGKAYRPARTNLKLIISKLESGVTKAQCFQLIAKKTREWKKIPRMLASLRPATLFHEEKFEQYFGELVPPTQEEQSDDL